MRASSGTMGTTDLPTLESRRRFLSIFANSKARVNVSSLVVTVFTTSTSFITGTGLKKCSPTIRSPRPPAAAIAAIVRLDVFDAKIVCAAHSALSSFQIAFLSSRSSTMASTTMSAGARSATFVVNVSRPSVSVRACSVSFPFSIALASDFSMLARARAADASSTSRTMVLNPFTAATCAMPEPMSPPPSTPTVAIVVIS